MNQANSIPGDTTDMITVHNYLVKAASHAFQQLLSIGARGTTEGQWKHRGFVVREDLLRNSLRDDCVVFSYGKLTFQLQSACARWIGLSTAECQQWQHHQHFLRPAAAALDCRSESCWLSDRFALAIADIWRNILIYNQMNICDRRLTSCRRIVFWRLWKHNTLQRVEMTIVVRCSTSSEWRHLSTGVILKCLGVRVTERTSPFWICWSRLFCVMGRP